MQGKVRVVLLISLGLIIAACGSTPTASQNASKSTAAIVERVSTLSISASKSSSIVAGKNLPQQVNTAFYLSKSIVYTSQQNGSGPTSSILQSENGGSSWKFLSSVPGIVSSIDFVTNKVGYLVSRPVNGGADNYLYASVNGGTTWTQVYAGSISTIKFLTPTTGFAMLRTPGSSSQPYSAGIYKTVNGGRTWSLVPSPLNSAATYGSFSFSSPSDGWLLVGIQPSAGSENKYLYETTDGGSSWNLVAQSKYSSNQILVARGVMPATGYVTQLQFISPQLGFMALARSGMYATDDGGLTWNLMSKTPMSAHSLRNVIGFSAWSRTDFSFATGFSNFWQPNSSGLMIRLYPPYRAQSIFQGSTGLYALSPRQGVTLIGSKGSVKRLVNTPSGITEINPLRKKLLALGTSGLYQSTSGTSWSRIPLPKGWTLLQGRFVDSNLGYIVASNNGPAGLATIDRTTNGGTSWRTVNTPFRPLVVDPISVSNLWALGGTKVPATNNPTKNVYQMEWNLYNSTNGGKSWNEFATNWQSIGGIDFLSTQEGYLWAGNYLYHTSNGGHSFVRYTLPSTLANQGILSMAFAPGGNGWALGNSQYPIYRTANSGGTWELAP